MAKSNMRDAEYQGAKKAFVAGFGRSLQILVMELTELTHDEANEEIRAMMQEVNQYLLDDNPQRN